tara:strand:+ start:8 stop:343 length:336 start_codon:yes stop_codon:yes gene_type:complete
MNKNIISDGKFYIENHDLIGIKEHCSNIKNSSQHLGYLINYQYIFIQYFNHACLKKSKEIIVFLIMLYYEIFDEISKIALRQCFFYGKYIIKNDRSFTKWYNEYIIKLFKI